MEGKLQQELQEHVASGTATRTMEEIQATLKVCRGGCEHYQDHLCKQRGHWCRHWKRWIERLIFTGCDREGIQ